MQTSSHISVHTQQQHRFSRLVGTALVAVFIVQFLFSQVLYAQDTDTSQLVTWSCSGSPCPWGTTLTDHAIVWPTALGAITNRLGYTTSAGIYLPANAATGLTVTITAGSATVYAGRPDASSHYPLAFLSTGQSYIIPELALEEVASVQSGSEFSYSLTAAPAPTPTPPPATATATPLPTITSPPTATPTTCTDPDACDPGTDNSQLITWSCSSSPCPWGTTLTDQALVWPEALGATNSRLGYTTSAGIYLPANTATGLRITITSGSATIYAGQPNAGSHYPLAALATGQSHVLTGLAPGEVVSVQSSAEFAYEFTWQSAATATPTATDPTLTPTTETSTPTAVPTEATPTATIVACTDPSACNPVSSIDAHWRCNIPNCAAPDWVGSVINWPSWAAYASNARSGSNSRTVYSIDGEILYPYMGAWADGCQITVVSGTALIIEWKRGTDVWRQTPLSPGETYTISLTAPEDGAMIETFDYYPPFSVVLENCTPEEVPVTPTTTTTPAATPTASPPTATPPACADPAACSSATATSEAVTWSCSDSPCPWGATTSGQAAVWPPTLGPISNRLGYTTSAGVYLPAGTATDLAITITSGVATIYAGHPDDVSHSPLTTLAAGQSYVVTSLASDDVLSVQSHSTFAYELLYPNSSSTPESIDTVASSKQEHGTPNGQQTSQVYLPLVSAGQSLSTGDPADEVTAKLDAILPIQVFLPLIASE